MTAPRQTWVQRHHVEERSEPQFFLDQATDRAPVGPHQPRVVEKLTRVVTRLAMDVDRAREVGGRLVVEPVGIGEPGVRVGEKDDLARSGMIEADFRPFLAREGPRDPRLAAQESALIAAETPERLMADILLVPHHGSKTSSSGAFLDAVSPQVAVFQVGYRNRYGHPHPQVWQRYVARDIDGLRTDKTGAVVIETGGDVLNVQLANSAGECWEGTFNAPTLGHAAEALNQKLKVTAAE